MRRGGMIRAVNAVFDVLFVGIIMLFLIYGFAKTVFCPETVNEYENRYCYKIGTLSVQSFADLSFQDGVEKALSDQTPKAQEAKKLFNDVNSKLSYGAVKRIIEYNDRTYITYQNGTHIFGGYYVNLPRDLAEIKPLLEAKAENYNSVFEACADVEFYVYYIERDTDIDFESGEKVNADEYLFSLLNLDADRKGSFEINGFKQYSEYFYKTDHHWKHAGSYAAYAEVAELLGVGNVITAGDSVLISDGFMGSKAATAASNIITEPFEAYIFDLPPMKVIRNSVPVNDYGAQNSYTNGETEEAVSYGAFYGGDDGEIIFDTGVTDLSNILVIGESYDNAILKLLAAHFNRTYSVDLRNYEYYFGEKFDLIEYVEKNDIEKVLFIGNISFYFMEEFELEMD